MQNAVSIAAVHTHTHTHTHTSNLVNQKLQLKNCGLLIDFAYKIKMYLKDSFKTHIEMYGV